MISFHDSARHLCVVCSIALIIAPLLEAETSLGADRALEKLDTVWLAPAKRRSTSSRWYPQPVEVLRGRLVKFDSKDITFSPAAGDEDLIAPADQVLWIEPGATSEEQMAMISLFREREFDKSLSRLPDILKARPPVWRQQWLTMMSAIAAYRSGRAKISLDLVAQLDRRALPPMVIAWLPIQWNGGAAPAVILEEAGKRIDDDSSLVQLVAASWLLSSPNRSSAIKKLQLLTRNRDRPSVARLAQVLLWTTKPPSEVIESESKWLAQLDSLPMVLQTGPSIALERKLRASGQVDSANHLLWSRQVTPVNRLLGVIQ